VGREEYRFVGRVPLEPAGIFFLFIVRVNRFPLLVVLGLVHKQRI
jgi:hypothetical protein